MSTIKPKHHKIIHLLAGRYMFMKLIGRNGFWEVHLCTGSSLLSTFNTHLGCLGLQRMLFRLKNVLWHIPNENIPESQYPRVLCIHNDVCSYGKGYKWASQKFAQAVVPGLQQQYIPDWQTRNHLLQQTVSREVMKPDPEKNQSTNEMWPLKTSSKFRFSQKWATLHCH